MTRTVMTTTAPATPDADSTPMLGGVMMLAAVGVRVLTTFDPMPGWSGDPLTMPSPIVGLTPAGALAADAAAVLGATLVLLGLARRGMGPGLFALVLVACGAAAAWLHGLVLPTRNPANVLTASAWTAAMICGVAAGAAARVPRLRALLVAGLLAMLPMLALRGIVQVTLEHPETYAAFLRQKADFLASHGWSEDSPMARAYERRLSQAEASGWFGLANVYASMAAAGTVALAGLAWRAIRANMGPGLRLASGAAGILGCAALVLAGAKGGYAAAAFGLALLAARPVLVRVVPARAAVVLGPAVALAALLAVVARGLVGERIHELSVLFRWFYISTAAKIAAGHPLVGVGPDGFKAAYSLLKPAISPEDVSSPHSVLFDFAATLGLGGVAWGVLLLGWASRAGRSLFAAAPAPPADAPVAPETRRLDVRLVMLALAAATVAAAYIEIPIATLEAGGVRLGGLLLGGGLAWAVLSIMRSDAPFPVGVPLAAAALAAIAHAQIELSPVTPGAGAWLFMLIALAGLPGAGRSERPSHAAARWGAPAVAAAMLVPLALAAPRLVTWDGLLRKAYAETLPATDLDALLRSPDPREHQRALEQAAAAVGLRPEQLLGAKNPAEVVLGLTRLSAADRALPLLQRAAQAQPDDAPTSQALCQLQLTRAAILHHAGAPPELSAAAVGQARAAAEAFAHAHPDSATLGWLATVLDGQAELSGQAEPRREACRAWERAAGLSPHAVVYPMLLARASQRLGDGASAARWAEAALANDAKCRLDPLAGLTDAGRAEMQTLAKATSNSAPAPAKTPGGP